jgi:hypothetical protein
MKGVRRILAVTAGLIITGAVAGGVAGESALTFCIILVTSPVPRLSGLMDWFAFGGILGAVLGGVTAPILAWLLLRQVPLGRMFAVCAVGTMMGGVVGWFATPRSGDIVLIPLIGAFLGCLLTAIALRYRVHHA